MPALNTQFEAPAGFGQLKAEHTYHFLFRDDDHLCRVTLVWFEEKPPRAHLEFLATADFDRGVKTGQIRAVDVTSSRRMPPWLSNLEDMSFDDDVAANLGRTALTKSGKPKLTRCERVDRRVQIISPAVDQYPLFFRELDPMSAIRRWIAEASKDGRELNGPRTSLWLLAYLAFGKNRWVLQPATKGRGDYSRAQAGNTKRGRPSTHGRGAGHNVDDDMKPLIKDGFLAYAGKGLTLVHVYLKTLEKKFKCTVTSVRGRAHIVHPQGKPFPTYGQFRYWVVKLLKHDVVWSTLETEQAYRNKHAPTKGSYSEGVQDLFEKIQADASQFRDLPKLLLSEGAGLPLKRVKIIDVLSGLGAGVAYGFGERGTLYKQALAACALPASVYGEVLGLKIRDEQLPVCCLPLTWQTDQGPGASKPVRKSVKQTGASADMTPPYTPQSDATVESSNPRKGVTSGAPTHTVSSLSALNMARHDFLDMLATNKSKPVTGRTTPAQAGQRIQSPLELWNALASVQRIAGIRKKEADVVRTLLPKVTFKIVGGRLTRCGTIYDSDEFRSTAFYRALRKHESKELAGYAFDISNRLEWVLVDNIIVRVRAIPRIAAAEGEYVMPKPDQLDFAKEQRRQKAEGPYMRVAERLARNIEAKKQTGKDYMPSSLRRGRAKTRTVAARQEAAATWN